MTTARQWFKTNCDDRQNKVYTSRYYTPDISWPKTHVWFLQIPIRAIDMKRYKYVNLVCQVAPGENKFHFLKVPTPFLNQHLDKFDRIKENIAIYLSANPEKLFKEERGRGEVNFRGFLVEDFGK
jgi:hypothetical protein